MGRLHIRFDFFHGAQLIGRFLKGEGRLQFAVHRIVGGKPEAGSRLALGVELHQLAGHFEDLFARAFLELFPGGTAQLAENGGFALGIGVLAQAVELFDGDEKTVFALVGDGEAVAFAVVDAQAADAGVTADAVVDMDDQISPLQSAVVGDGCRRAEFAIAVAASLAAENLVVVEQGQLRLWESEAPV